MTTGAKLYLIPNFLGERNADLLTSFSIKKVHELTEFIVESEKSARAFLKAIDHPTPQDDFVFHLLNKHTHEDEIPEFLQSCLLGQSIGLLSDAGVPCIADPGNLVVSMAHDMKVQVVPLSGMSSIIMALMASGFNGQQFRFHGYLPFDKKERQQLLTKVGQDAQKGESQLFIETPYRNVKLIQELQKKMPPSLELLVATDLSLRSEQIERRAVRDWTGNLDHLHKRPAVFVLGKAE